MKYFEPYNNTISEMAKSIRWDTKDYLRQVGSSLDMISKAIRYTSDIATCGLRDCKTSVSNALRTGKGDCEEMAAAVASLNRAIDIQENRLFRERVIIGWFRRTFNEEFAGHVWAEAWDDKYIYVLETTATPPMMYIYPKVDDPYSVLLNYIPIEYVYV